MGKTDYETYLERAFRATCDHQGQFVQAEEKARKKYRHHEREVDNRLRVHLDSLITDLGNTLVNNKIASPASDSSYQLSLCTSLIRCHFIVNDLLMKGNIIEAVTLVRRQLEGLARLYELDQSPVEKIEGQAPRVTRAVGSYVGRLYGLLSEITHFSRARVGDFLSVDSDGDLIGPSPFPKFQEEAFACFDRHAYVSFMVASWLHQKQKSEWYPKTDFSLREELLTRTFLVALEAGVVKLPDGIKLPDEVDVPTSKIE